ncbi:MAG TPA: hypothetical protein VFL14_10930 [Xanthomonadales bacterium]|nr:hypothetical protein [Xanthomonadales bacterium]
MSTVAWVIVGVVVVTLLFLGAARAGSASMGSHVRQGASNNRPVAVAQAEVAARSVSLEQFEVAPKSRPE